MSSAMTGLKRHRDPLDAYLHACPAFTEAGCATSLLEGMNVTADPIHSMQQHPSSRGILNYGGMWNDQMLQLELDEMNLTHMPQGAQGAANVPEFLLEEAGHEEEDRRKRTREAVERDSLEHFLKDLGREQEQASGGSGAGHHGETTRQQAQSDEKGKRTSNHADAAKTKAGRERARRERLNERCASHEPTLPI